MSELSRKAALNEGESSVHQYSVRLMHTLQKTYRSVEVFISTPITVWYLGRGELWPDPALPLRRVPVPHLQ